MARDFQKLRVKAKEVDIEGEKIMLKGLSFPELAEFTIFMDKKDTKGGMNYLLKTTLRKAFTQEEATDSEVDKLVTEMSSGVASTIIKEVTTLSGLSTPDDGKKLEGVQ